VSLPSDEKTSIPTPPGLNTGWKPPADMTRPLTSFQEDFVLSICPKGTRLLSARFYRAVRLPCPIWVRLAFPDGEERRLILRMDYMRGGVEREAAILPLLAKFGLPVPRVLAGPVIDPTQPEAGPMTILSVLPGQDLLVWGRQAAPARIERAMGLILDGVAMLHGVTERLYREPDAAMLPRKTLHTELQAVIANGGPWFDELIFRQAVDSLLPLVSSIRTPLAFSSGDYNQGNFLFEDERLTGIVDFSGSCFEDPHVGMAMYWLYCWDPFHEAGIVERYLEQRQISFADFAPRLALRCLRTLQEGIPVGGGEDVRDEYGFESYADARKRVLGLLQRAMDVLT
jgi:aminoglycoside phosphotransferase